MTTYTYSIENNFPNHIVDSSRFTLEITGSAIVIALDHIDTLGDDCNIVFKADLSNDDKVILDGLVAAHSGEPLPQPKFDADGTPIISMKQRQSDGIPVFATAPRDGSEWVVGSHNFCDPCSWFGDSVRVNDEVMTDSGGGLTWNSQHINWIDMVSGRMHNDEMWCRIQKEMNPGDPHGYKVIVKVDGYVVTPCPLFTEVGGDYWIDWDAGKVVFLTSQAGKSVTVSYNYATTNTFCLRPSPGKMLAIEDAETDISNDVVMTDTIAYSAWYFNGSEYVQAIEVAYKRAGQIVTEARGCYPIQLAVGASTAHKQISDIREFRRKSRGMKFDRQAIPFQYSTVRWLRSSYMQEMRVYTSSGLVFEGEHVTVTFYCTEKDE